MNSITAYKQECWIYYHISVFAVCSLSKIQDSQGMAPHICTPRMDKQPQRYKIWITKTFWHGPELTPPSKHPPYKANNYSVQEFPTLYRNWSFITMLIFSNVIELQWQMLRLQCLWQMTEWVSRIREMKQTRKSWSTYRKLCLNALCPPQILHRLESDWTQPLQWETANYKPEPCHSPPMDSITPLPSHLHQAIQICLSLQAS